LYVLNGGIASVCRRQISIRYCLLKGWDLLLKAAVCASKQIDLGLEVRISDFDEAPPTERRWGLCSEIKSTRLYLPGSASAAWPAVMAFYISAKLNNVDPLAWLADTLARIADIPQGRLHELLPRNWKPAATQLPVAA
jgi:IS66 C-terminal element